MEPDKYTVILVFDTGAIQNLPVQTDHGEIDAARQALVNFTHAGRLISLTVTHTR